MFCSQKTVTLTLWGETAIDKGPLLEEHTNPVVIITSCRVSDYDGNLLYDCFTVPCLSICKVCMMLLETLRVVSSEDLGEAHCGALS